MKSSRKKTIILLVITLCLLSLIPLPVREKDKKEIAEQSVLALIDNDNVLIWKGMLPGLRLFYDAERIDKQRTLLYNNSIGIDDGVFEKIGLKKYSSDEYKKHTLSEFYKKNILIEFTYNNPVNQVADKDIHFNYYHGWMKYQGYKVKVYHNIWGYLVFYFFEWAS